MAVELLAKIWPEWKIENQLGRGSYGVVYKAVREDDHMRSNAAIKVISIPSDASEIDSLRSEGFSEEGAKTYFQEIVNDFVGEIRLMDSLKGVQNIVSVEDYKVVESPTGLGWNIFIRMELLTPFNTYLLQNPMSEDDVIKLGIDICSALEICGQRNIVHRDIKPENIFINSFGHFKLGDFGIARKLENATGGMSQKGTFNYMAPEVATSNNYDATVDIYSLGIVLYRLLNGNKLPFITTEAQLQNPNERKKAVDRRIRGEQLPAPSNASEQVAAVILKACAYNPGMRFANATQMKRALEMARYGIQSTNQTELDETVTVRHAAQDLNSTVMLNTDTGKQQPPVVTGGTNPGFSGSYGGQTNPSGNFGNRTNDPGNISGSMSGNMSGSFQAGGHTVPNNPKKAISKLCVVSLILCLVPLLLDLILVIAGQQDKKLLCSGIELISLLIPLFAAGAALSSAYFRDQKGKLYAFLSMAVTLLMVWILADTFFTQFNKAYLGDSSMAATLHVVYFAIHAVLVCVMFFKAKLNKT